MSNTKDDVSNFDDTSSSASNQLHIQSNRPSESSQNGSPAPRNSASPSDYEGSSISAGERRSTRRPIPNSKYSNDFVLPSNIEHLMRSFSPKRSHATSDSDQSMAKQRPREKTPQKKMKTSTRPSTNRQDFTQHGDLIAKVGSLRLPWPRYGIKDAVYESQHFSIFHTCPLDTGLFAVYHAYKAGSDAFRLLFENDTVEALTLLRHIFQLVESDGWTVARLFWLTRNHLLTVRDSDGRYNLKNTLNEIVFRFITPMQSFRLFSECSCLACSKPVRSGKSVDIALS